MSCNNDKIIYKSQNEAKSIIAGMNNAKFKDNIEIESPEDIAKRKGRQKFLKRLSNKKKVSMKAYFCEDCNGWHLTTQNKKKVKPFRGNTGVKEISTNSKNKHIVRIKNPHNFAIK